MKKALIILTVILASFLLIQNVCANEIYSETNTVDLTAGCETTFSITIINDENAMDCYIESEVNSEGIYVSYDKESPFELKKGTNIIQVTVNTSMLLAPGNYVIKTTFLKNAPTTTSSKKEPRRTSNPPGIKPEPTYDAPYDPPDLFPPYEPGEPQHWTYVSPAQGGFPFKWVVPVLLIGTVFTLLFLLYRRRKQK